MFTIIIWLIVIVLGISVITSAIHKGGIDDKDLLQLFGIAVGVLTALYSMDSQSVLVQQRQTETNPAILLTDKPTETFILVEPTVTSSWAVTEIMLEIVTPSGTPTMILITNVPQSTSTSPPTPVPTSTSIPTSSPSPTLRPIAISPTKTPILTVVSLAHQKARMIVKGIGAASDNVTNPALRERSALLAAELDAKRQLAEWTEGAVIESVTITEAGTLTEDTIRQSIKAKVPPHSVIEKRYDSTSGIGYVTLELIVEPD